MGEVTASSQKIVVGASVILTEVNMNLGDPAATNDVGI